jgi:hypothetical protein
MPVLCNAPGPISFRSCTLDDRLRDLAPSPAGELTQEQRSSQPKEPAEKPEVISARALKAEAYLQACFGHWSLEILWSLRHCVIGHFSATASRSPAPPARVWPLVIRRPEPLTLSLFSPSRRGCVPPLPYNARPCILEPLGGRVCWRAFHPLKPRKIIRCTNVRRRVVA